MGCIYQRSNQMYRMSEKEREMIDCVGVCFLKEIELKRNEISEDDSRAIHQMKENKYFMVSAKYLKCSCRRME